MSCPSFLCYSWFDGHFFGERPQLRFDADGTLKFFPKDAIAVNEGLLWYTFLALGILCAVGGFLLLTGGPVASRIYSVIGLAEEPRREMRQLASVLQLSAVWHLGMGWLFYTMEMKDWGNKTFLVFWFVVVFGAIPGILAPFYLRGKRWSLWTVFVVFLLVCLLYTVAFGSVYLASHPAVKPPLADQSVPIIYWVLSGTIACTALRSIWTSRSIVAGSTVAKELRRLLSLHDALLDSQRQSKPLWVPTALSGVGALVSFIAAAIAYGVVYGPYRGNDARFTWALLAMLVGGVATFIVVWRLAGRSGKQKEKVCRTALSEAVGEISISSPAVVAAVGSRDRLFNRQAIADALAVVRRARATRGSPTELPPRLPHGQSKTS
jgi:hypothetical protein